MSNPGWLTRNYRKVLICIGLVLLVSAPTAYWGMIQYQTASTRSLEREPSDLYFLCMYPPHMFDLMFDNETDMFTKVWNSTRQLAELCEFSDYGEYSVLIFPHAYGVGAFSGGEWFVVASTLQSNTEGFIHELVLRLEFSNFSLVRSYSHAYSLNLTESIEEGKKIADDLIAQDPYQYWIGFPDVTSYHTKYPFLVLFIMPSDFGITVILNMKTSKIMIAATGVWTGHGKLIYPESANPS